MALQDYLQSVVEREALPPAPKTMTPDVERREEAVRRVVEFGEKYSLSLGKPLRGICCRMGAASSLGFCTFMQQL